MRYFALLLSLLFYSGFVQAQQPLSKRDQQRKAEFLAQIEAEKKYEQVKDAADKAFVGKDYVKSRMLYNEAIQYSAENAQWLTSKVNDLDILMAEIVAREVDSIDVIEKNQPIAIAPKEAVVSEIQGRDEKMVVSLPAVKEEEIETEPKIEETIPDPKPQIDPEPVPEVVAPQKPKPIQPKKEKATERVKEDYSKYPQGRSDETFTFPDHTVRRVIVRDGIDTIVYKYVTHRWGGKYYFKDDVSIVERIWKQEVEAFEEKHPTNSADD